jgi:hypothetical protein
MQTKLKLLMFWMKYRKYIIPAAVILVAVAAYFLFVHR